MPKISVNILTKNRAQLLKRALASVLAQNFQDLEIIVINDGSTDGTQAILQSFNPSILKFFNHEHSVGITQSRQEALLASTGEYVAVLDDDDEWTDKDKLARQVKFLDENQEYVLAGGGIEVKCQMSNVKCQKFRPERDSEIRRTMLFRNNFFTSTVMFRRQAALKAGGFACPVRDTEENASNNQNFGIFKNNLSTQDQKISNGVKDAFDLAEDYDLWLRMGKLGKMYNFQEAFVNYRLPSYNKEKFVKFLTKQSRLIGRERFNYPMFWLADLFLKIRQRVKF